MARDCVKRLVETSKGILSQQDARELMGEVDRAAKRRANEGFDYDDSVKQVLSERMDNVKTNIVKQKENIARNVVIRQQSVDKVSSLVDEGLSIKDAFRADLEGIESHIAGARDSLAVKKTSVENAYFSKLLGELNKEGLLPVFNSKTLNDQIGSELWALSLGESGATGNKQAARIAKIVFDTREAQRKRLNAAGADIAEVGGYIMPQRHDTFEMLRVKEKKWVEDMLPLVDQKRSFNGDYENLSEALGAAYRAMVTGIRLNDPLVDQPKLFQFTGPGNLGKRLSQSRQIHFKDYASWKKWNDTYGMRDMNEGIIDAVRYDANNIAIMERYGTNPEAMIDEVASQIKKTHRDKAAAEGELGIDSKIDSITQGVLDKNMIPADPRLARIGSNIRVFQNVTKLGGVLISSTSDIPLKSLEYQFQGKSWLSSHVQPWLDIAQGFKSKKERVEFASLTGVGFESMIADIGGRFSATDSLSNRAGKVQRMFFKLNGLSWWTDSHKNAMGRVMSHHLGLKKKVKFSNLDEDTRRLFGNYNITEADWDIMRKAVTKLDDGREYILPDQIDSIPVKEKLIGYYADRADAGVLTPGAREQRLTTLGLKRGTAAGEAMMLVMQFKSFATSIVTKVWGRALYGKGKADVPAMAYLMLNTMLFGYMAGSMKDLVKGKTPKDPTKPETAFASLAQGGGLGIFGDILLQDGASFGRSFSQIAAGPTFGTIDDVFKIYSAGVRGGGSKAQLFKTAVGAVPFNNLFYTRAALDQMLFLQIQEELNPGYLRRMERNMKKTYGQELLFR